jgi:hypothetical protein
MNNRTDAYSKKEEKRDYKNKRPVKRIGVDFLYMGKTGSSPTM